MGFSAGGHLLPWTLKSFGCRPVYFLTSLVIMCTKYTGSVRMTSTSPPRHLAGSVATLHTRPANRPDFAVLVYPVVTMEGSWRHQGSRER
jgi:hypothetical protein